MCSTRLADTYLSEHKQDSRYVSRARHRFAPEESRTVRDRHYRISREGCRPSLRSLSGVGQWCVALAVRDHGAMPSLDVIGVIVSNVQKAIEFYERLGLRFPEDPDPEAHGHVETTLPGGLRFCLDAEDSIRSFDPDWSPPSGGHRMAIAFRCEAPDDVDRVYRELIEAGAESQKEPWDAFWGQRYAQAKDPDGNVVDLFAPIKG
jgi:uncharacterized glyoxalase superfamily protein PhnB